MRIKQVQIKNFKRFKDLTIDLGDEPKRIIALVGPNGCGKSSVFDAMLALAAQYGNGAGSNADSRTYSDSYMGFSSATGEPIRERVEITYLEGKHFEMIQRFNKRATPTTLFSFRSPYRYQDSVLVSQISSVKNISENNEGASRTSDQDSRVRKNYERLYGQYFEYLENNENVTTAEAKQFFIDQLNASLSRCLDLKIFSIGNIQQGKGTLYFQKDDQPDPFPFDVLSAGEKEVFDILLDLFLRKENYRDSIFLIDEPELHINANIQRKLLNEINDLVGEDSQIWIATHSIGFLRALQEDFADQSQVIEFIQGKKWGSATIVLEPVAPDARTWQRLFATALDDLANMVCPKRIIYCEGKAKPGYGNREDGFDARVLNIVFGEARPDTQFVSGGGCSELDEKGELTLLVLSKVLPDLEVWLLKDRDMVSGGIATESDRIDYLRENPTTHRVLKRHELENYLFDKEVLQAYADRWDKSFNEDAYNRIVSDIVNDDLKSQWGSIAKALGIMVNIGCADFKFSLADCISPDMHVYKELNDIIFERS